MTPTLDIPKMLQYWGTPFMTVVYRCFLNREPDPEGLKYYLGRLETGIDRLTIIEQFVKSSEVKAHFSPQQLLLIKFEINRLKAIHHSGFLPIARVVSGSLNKSERIMMNKVSELQFHLERPDIPSSSQFLHTPKYLEPFKITKVSQAFNYLKNSKSEGNLTSNSISHTLNDSEKKLFNKIIKQI